MSVECFIDTNLFIYQLEVLDERKFTKADRIIREGIETRNACISFQVVQECLNTALRKAEIPLSTDERLSGKRSGALKAHQCECHTKHNTRTLEGREFQRS